MDKSKIDKEIFVGGLVSDPIIFSFWTMCTILEVRLCSVAFKTNFYTKNYFGRGALTPPPSIYMGSFAQTLHFFAAAQENEDLRSPCRGPFSLLLILKT